MKKIELFTKKNCTTVIKGNNINNFKNLNCISNSHICTSNIFINDYNNYLNKSNSHLETDLYIRNLVDTPNKLPFFSKTIEKGNLKDLNLKKWSCPICLIKISNPNLIVKTSCNHYICIYCMYKLFLTNYKKTKCPICRNKLNQDSIFLIKKKNNTSYINLIKQIIRLNYDLSLKIFGEKTIYLIKNQYLFRQSIIFNFNSKNCNWNNFMNKLYGKKIFYNIYDLINNLDSIQNIINFDRIKNIIILKIILNNQELDYLHSILLKIKKYEIDNFYFKKKFLCLKKTIEEKVYREEVVFN